MQFCSNHKTTAMVTAASFRKLALQLAGTTESPHFERTSFRVKKKIYATLDEKRLEVTVKLNEIDQSVFTAIDRQMIHAVPNKWGLQGWTIIHLPLVTKPILKDALRKAWQTVQSS